MIEVMSKEAFEFMMSKEAFVAKPYLCPAKKWTQGYGTTVNPDTGLAIKPTDSAITKETAIRWAKVDLANKFLPIIKRLVKRPLLQCEQDGLLLFTYNTGGYYKNPSGKYVPYNLWGLVERDATASVMRNYWRNCAITANGKKLNGLVERRKVEVEFYLKDKKEA